MNPFKRFSTIVNANVNAALDKMEDPKKMIDLMIEELEEARAKTITTLATHQAELKGLERKLTDLTNSITRWTERATKAVEAGNDALAREALAEKQKAAATHKTLTADSTTLKAIIQDEDEQKKRIEEKLAQIKARKMELTARGNEAKSKMQNARTIEKSDSVAIERKFEELQSRIDRWEAEANCHMQKSDEAFVNLESNSGIEAELAALKDLKAKE